MKGELVTTVTEDKVRLDGFYAVASETSLVEIDAAVIIHGLSGNFYKSRLLKHFATILQNHGVHSLLVNTRGHDYLNSTPRIGRASTLGAAVEIIDECRYDLFAWVEFLKRRGADRILLLGHSLGAIKSLYAQAHQPHENVVGIAAFSATKLSYESLLGSGGGEQFVHWIKKSQEMVSDGRGDEFLFVDFPFPTWMSAHAYLAKYGDGDRNNWLSFYQQIDAPVLAAFGEREMQENPAFRAMRQELDSMDQENFSVRFIPHADHFYSACYDAASDCLLTWMKMTDFSR